MIGSEYDATAPLLVSVRLGHLDLRASEVRPGVRRAVLPRQSPALTPGQRRRRRRLDKNY